MAKPMTANTESPKWSIWRAVKRFFRKKWMEFITTVVLILTLWTYLAANGLNRKAAIIAHTPWMSADPQILLTPSSDDKSLVIATNIQNTSDSPALDSTVFWVFYPEKGAPDPNTDTTPDNKPVTIMPHDARGVEFVATSKNTNRGGEFSANSLKEQIERGDIMVRMIMRYSDVFGDKITITSDFSRDPAANVYKVRNNAVSGFQSY